MLIREGGDVDSMLILDGGDVPSSCQDAADDPALRTLLKLAELRFLPEPNAPDRLGAAGRRKCNCGEMAEVEAEPGAEYDERCVLALDGFRVGKDCLDPLWLGMRDGVDRTLSGRDISCAESYWEEFLREVWKTPLTNSLTTRSSPLASTKFKLGFSDPWIALIPSCSFWKRSGQSFRKSRSTSKTSTTGSKSVQVHIS